MKKRSWTEVQLRQAAANVFSIRQVLKSIGLVEAGGNYAQIKKYLKEYKIETSHFKGKSWNKGLRGLFRRSTPLKQILVKGSDYQSFKLKKRLFAEKIKTAACELCGWAKATLTGRVPLELDHINGDRYDNRLINLRVLCPNCHSLQSTHRGLNKKIKR